MLWTDFSKERLSPVSGDMPECSVMQVYWCRVPSARVCGSSGLVEGRCDVSLAQATGGRALATMWPLVSAVGVPSGCKD